MVYANQKEHSSGDCPMKKSGYSSGHSSDGMRGYERRTEDKTRVFYIFVGVDMKMSPLSVLRIVIMTVYLLTSKQHQSY